MTLPIAVRRRRSCRIREDRLDYQGNRTLELSAASVKVGSRQPLAALRTKVGEADLPDDQSLRANGWYLPFAVMAVIGCGNTQTFAADANRFRVEQKCGRSNLISQTKRLR